MTTARYQTPDGKPYVKHVIQTRDELPGDLAQLSLIWQSRAQSPISGLRHPWAQITPNGKFRLRYGYLFNNPNRGKNLTVNVAGDLKESSLRTLTPEWQTYRYVVNRRGVSLSLITSDTDGAEQVKHILIITAPGLLSAIPKTLHVMWSFDSSDDETDARWPGLECRNGVLQLTSTQGNDKSWSIPDLLLESTVVDPPPDPDSTISAQRMAILNSRGLQAVVQTLGSDVGSNQVAAYVKALESRLLIP